jgi:chemotaxis protein CheC
MMTEEDKEVLAELINISFGAATAVISDMLGTFATLHIPQVEVFSVREMRILLNEKIRQSPTQLICTSQLFFGDLDGETVFVIDETSALNVARYIGGSTDPGKLGRDQILDPVLEVGNILSAACLKKLNKQLGLVSVFTMPSVEFLPKEGIAFEELEGKGGISGEANAILVNTELDFQEEKIAGSIYIVLDSRSFEVLVRKLKDFFAA